MSVIKQSEVVPRGQIVLAADGWGHGGIRRIVRGRLIQEKAAGDYYLHVCWIDHTSAPTKIPAKFCWFTRPDHIPDAGEMVQDHIVDSDEMVSPNA